MSLTVDNVNAQLVDLFAKVGQTIAEQITGNALPLIGKLSELGGGAAASKIFDDLKTQVVGALDTANTAIQNDPTTEAAKAIADAINALGVTELSAKQTDAGGLDIAFKADRTLDTGKTQINVGKAVGDRNVIMRNTVNGSTVFADRNAGVFDGRRSVAGAIGMQWTAVA